MAIFKVSLLVLLMVAAIPKNYAEEDLEDEGVDLQPAEDLDEPPVPEPPKDRPAYKAPEAKGNAYFTEAFISQDSFGKRWILSEAKKDGAEESIAKYDGQWAVEEPATSALKGDLALILKSKAKHHAISAPLDRPYEFSGKPFIMQYEVKFENNQECGGAYVKLLTKKTQGDLHQLMDKTPYTIMFGPDKCGLDNKLHFIFRHKNPKTGAFEEKHSIKPKSGLEHIFTDKKTHLYTLVINPDNSFEILIDQSSVKAGNLLEDVEPPVNPATEIVDPTDKKPADWDETEKIPDPKATKPEDWDESEPAEIVDEEAVMPSGWLENEAELIPDPSAEKPSDWDADLDGDWEAPSITNPQCESAPGCGPWTAPMKKNPKFKGKWRAPLIDNPNYKGKWTAKKIPNPDYFEDKSPYKMTTIGAVGLELWSMSNDIVFDNFIITDDRSVADQWAADSWSVKYTQERASGASIIQSVMDVTNEKPWLWAVFVFVIVLPLILLIYYCCCTASSPAEPARTSHKKTDAPAADDEKEEAADNEETKTAEAASDSDAVRQRKPESKKATLNEAPPSDDGENVGDGDNQSSSKSSKKKAKARKD